MNDPHITNRLQQIGNICQQWSCLEYLLANAIWLLTGIHNPEVGKIVTANLDFKQRVSMVFALAHETNAPVPFKIAIKKLQDEVRNGELIHKRNQAVHGIQFPADRPDAVEIEMHRGKGGRKPRIQLDADLNALGNDIARVRDDFSKSLVGLIEHVHADRVQRLKSLGELKDIIRNSSANIDGSEMNGPE